MKPNPEIPVSEIQARIRTGLTRFLQGRGFRPAADVSDAWVKACCEGALQRIQVTWVMRSSQRYVIASLAFAYHLVEPQKLWTAISGRFLRDIRYGEDLPSLRRRLADLTSDPRRREWRFPRSEFTQQLVDSMGVAVERYGLPYLERLRSRDEVFAEVERIHLARRNPSIVEELEFSCNEFCCGGRDAAMARVERVLVLLEREPQAESARWKRMNRGGVVGTLPHAHVTRADGGSARGARWRGWQGGTGHLSGRAAGSAKPDARSRGVA